MKLTKTEVATRQLDTAIKLFFDAGDAVSIHTLAAASLTVFGDILEQIGQTSWREQTLKEYPNLTKPQFLKILRTAQNFFKHAARDHDESLEFSDTHNDAMIWIATLEWGFLNKARNHNRKERKKLSTHMSIFHLWYLATKSGDYVMPENVAKAANALFPGINRRTRSKQLSMGATALKNREGYNRRPPPSH